MRRCTGDPTGPGSEGLKPSMLSRGGKHQHRFRLEAPWDPFNVSTPRVGGGSSLDVSFASMRGMRKKIKKVIHSFSLFHLSG